MQYRRFNQCVAVLAMASGLWSGAWAQDRQHASTRLSDAEATAPMRDVPASSQPVTWYQLYDVGALSGGSSVFYNWDQTGGVFTPSSFNSSGQLAGSGLLLSKKNLAGSYLWSSGNLHHLPSLPHANKFKDGGSNALGLNDHGLAIGISANDQFSSFAGFPFYHAVSWTHGKIADLGDFGGNASWAEYVNDSGLIVGFAYNNTPDQYSFYGTQFHAAAWQNGQIQDLGTLGGSDSEAWTVNSSGQVIGNSFTNNQPGPPFNQPQEDAFVWQNGQMTDLGNLGGGFSTPSAINRGGDITVISFDASNQHFQSFLWSNGTQYPLPTLGGDFVEASTLNDWDLITGASSDAGDTNFQAALWIPWAGVSLSLGTVDGDSGSFGLGVNNSGVIVGGSGSITLSGAPAYAHAFVWQNGQIQDLNTLVDGTSSLTLNVAYAVNDHGEIAGLGTNSSGETHAFVLIPQSYSRSLRYPTAADSPAAPGSSIKMASPMQRGMRGGR